jgi:hypothetical protein
MAEMVNSLTPNPSPFLGERSRMSATNKEKWYKKYGDSPPTKKHPLSRMPFCR